VTVTHDREFIRNITCDRMLEVREGRVVELDPTAFDR
jgi:ATPase subunit of ABC transporter with duplicated ATPase domains